MDAAGGTIQCPDEHRLEMLASGAATEPALDRHLAECQLCRAVFADIVANNQFLSRAAPILRSYAQPRWGEITAAESIPGLTILGEIHRGGQGIVYKAFHEQTKRFVAIKLLLHGAFATPRQRHRFEREIEIASGLRHPYIVTLYETNALTGGRVGYVMEYVDGFPLDQWAAGIGPATRSPADMNAVVTRKLQLLLKICDAIRYAHLRGIIHRDLKPGNIIIDSHDDPHVLDFGLAKSMSHAAAGENSAAALTQTGEIVGTYLYTAPEQLQGDPELIDTRTDVYALGVVAYELLTGRLPHAANDSMTDLIRSILTNEPQPPSTLCPAIDNDLETIILKALAKEAQRRYASAHDLHDDIARYMRGDAIDAKRDSTWYMLRKTARRHRAALTVAVSIVLLLMGFATIMTVQARRLALERNRATEALMESNLERAAAMTQIHNVPAAEELLWDAAFGPSVESAPAPRNWPGPFEVYWRLVDLYRRNPCLTTMQATYGRANSFALSPCAPIVAVADAEGAIFVRQLDPPRLLQTLTGHVGNVGALQFDPTGSRLASGGEDGTARLWDPLTGEQLQVFPLSGSPVRSINFSTDATSLVCSGEGGASVIDLQSGRIIRRWQSDSSSFMHTTINPTNDVLLSWSSREPVVQLWSMSTGELLMRLEPQTADPKNANITTASFLPDGRTVAIGVDGQIQLWDWHSNSLQQTITSLGSHGMRVSSDGQMIAAIHMRDRTLRVAALGQPNDPVVLSGHVAGPLGGFAFSPTQARIISADLSGVLKQWELEPARWLQTLGRHQETVFALQLSPDGSTLASGSDDHSIMLWDLRTRQLRTTLHGHRAGVTALAFSPDGILLASGGHQDDPVILIWEVATGTLLRRIEGHKDWVTSLSFGDDGLVLASGSGSKSPVVHVWDVATGQEIRRHVETSQLPRCCAFSHGGDMLAWSESSGDIHVESANAETSRQLRGHLDSVREIAFSPNDELLASGADDSTVRLWDIASGRCIHVLQGHNSRVGALAFSSDGSLVASADYEGAICLWKAATGRLLLTAREPGSAIFSLLFADQDRTLVCAGSNREIELRDLSYYDRHIAGNTAWQIGRRNAAEFDQRHAASLQQWAAQILTGPSASVPLPDNIRAQ